MVQVAYDLTLARYYMWAQTEEHVYLAVHVPTGKSWQASVYLHLFLFMPGTTGSPALWRHLAPAAAHLSAHAGCRLR